MQKLERHEFASDNTAGICPEAWAALEAANKGECASYAEDPWTNRLQHRVAEIFETECTVYPVFNGTAANALALAAICRPFHSIICHELAHIQTDECGAPEFFSGGGKLLPISGANGKIDLADAAAIIASQHGVHSHKPRAISITQATELGTTYKPDEIGAAAQFAHRQEMFVHMDGARFSNAVASLKCAPRGITWELGVDVLCLGGTKNGLAAGDLVIFFRRDLANEFDYRAKQGGQLASKTRFLSAPWLALLADDLWLKNAGRANAAAGRLASRLEAEANLRPVFPIEANAVFLRLNNAIVTDLQSRGWQFYKFVEPDIYRLMCSWAVTDQAIDDLVRDMVEATRVQSS